MKNFLLPLVLVVGTISSAHAQSSITAAPKVRLLESYRAYIGRSDLFNSSGVRLTRPWQIIRQDRANVHLYGVRDRGDQLDSFFADAANRQIMEGMLQNGKMSAEAAQMIILGDVWIDVEIYGSGGIGRWIDVMVSD